MKRKPLHPRGQEVCVRLCLSEWHLPHSCKDRSSHALIIIIDKWYLMSGIWLTAQPYPPSTWADTCVNLQRLKKKNTFIGSLSRILIYIMWSFCSSDSGLCTDLGNSLSVRLYPPVSLMASDHLDKCCWWSWRQQKRGNDWQRRNEDLFPLSFNCPVSTGPVSYGNAWRALRYIISRLWSV